MILLGQRMYDNFAEALDDVTVCVMGRDDVRRLLLSDARIATTLTTLATQARRPQIALTHEQIAALTGTSRETTTKVLRASADRGLIRLSRGHITVLDPVRLHDETG